MLWSEQVSIDDSSNSSETLDTIQSFILTINT